MTARQILLDGLARDAGIFELVSELAPLHPRDNTFPGEVFLHLAADALDWCGASRAGPLSLEGLREQFLPECTFPAGKTRSSSTRCWPRRPCMAGPNRICWMRSPGGRPTTSGSTACSRRSATSAPPRAGGCAGASGMPGPGRAPWPPSAITSSSGGCGSGHLTAGRPIIRRILSGALVVVVILAAGRTAMAGMQAWQMRCLPLPVAGTRGRETDVGCLDAGGPIASASVRRRRTGPYGGMKKAPRSAAPSSGTVGAARAGMLAQAPAPAWTDAARTGVAWR